MKKHSLHFLRFLECAAGLHDTGIRSFGIPHALMDEARQTGWFIHHKDWDCFTDKGMHDAVCELNECSYSHDRSVRWALTPHEHLPLYAKVAIERLGNDSSLRSHETFMTLLGAYAGSYGEVVDIHVRDSAENVCLRRFHDYAPCVPPLKPEREGLLSEYTKPLSDIGRDLVVFLQHDREFSGLIVDPSAKHRLAIEQDRYELAPAYDDFEAIVRSRLPVFEAFLDYQDASGHLDAQDVAQVIRTMVTLCVEAPREVFAVARKISSSTPSP